MKVIKHHNNGNTYEHNGVTFKCTDEAIVDAQSIYDINLLAHIEKRIDELLCIAKGHNLPTDFSVRCKIIRGFSDDLSEATSSIIVVKMDKHPD
jgi:hypothetical protein